MFAEARRTAWNGEMRRQDGDGCDEALGGNALELKVIGSGGGDEDGC